MLWGFVWEREEVERGEGEREMTVMTSSERN
jgi:hypothetical protein